MVRQPGENPAEIDLPVAQRAEPPGALGPRRVGAIDPGAPGGAKLGVLDVERLDPLVVDVDERQIVELLQHEVAGIVQDVGARVLIDRVEEALESHPVVQVLAGVELVAGVHPVLVERVEDRLPAPPEFGKAFLDQPGRALRPRIHHVPHQRARKGRVAGAAEPAAGLRGQLQLLDRPGLPRLGMPVELARREAVELAVVGGVRGDQLALKMRRQLGDLDAVGGADALDLVGIVLALGGLLEIEQPCVPGRDLDALVAQPGGPLGDRVERIERREVARELGEEDGGALDRHVMSSRSTQTAPARLEARLAAMNFIPASVLSIVA